MSGWPHSQLRPMDRTSPEARRSERMEVNPNSAVCSAPLLIRGPIAPSNSFCELTLHSQVTLWIESRGHARGCPTEPRPELVRELCECTAADGARRQADCGSGAAKRSCGILGSFKRHQDVAALGAFTSPPPRDVAAPAQRWAPQPQESRRAYPFAADRCACD